MWWRMFVVAARQVIANYHPPSAFLHVTCCAHSLLAACLSFDSGGTVTAIINRGVDELLPPPQPRQLLSKLHIFKPDLSLSNVHLWAVERGGGDRGIIRTRGTCIPAPSPSFSGGGVASMTCSGQLCCATRDSNNHEYADGGGQCWMVDFDASALCRVVYDVPPSPRVPLPSQLSSQPPLSLCTDGQIIHVLTFVSGPQLYYTRQLTVLSFVPQSHSIIHHETSRIPFHASQIACGPSFSLLSSSTTGYIRSAVCNAPVHHMAIPIPSAMSRDFACALHPTTLSLLCWGNAPLAHIVPLVVVCIPDELGQCTLAPLARGEGGYQLAPRLYDSIHTDGRYLEIMPVALRGMGEAVCDSSTDVARISVLSVSFAPSAPAHACSGATCSCTM